MEWTVLVAGLSDFGGAISTYSGVFFDALADQFIYDPPATDWSGHVLLPVRADEPLTVVEQDRVTGWLIRSYGLGEIPLDPNLAEATLALPAAAPMLVDARPSSWCASAPRRKGRAST